MGDGAEGQKGGGIPGGSHRRQPRQSRDATPLLYAGMNHTQPRVDNAATSMEPYLPEIVYY